MIQSDSPSWCPDHGTNKSTRREDQILLPDNLFVNLLDIDLQGRILNPKDLDIDIKNIIETIQKNGPTNLLNDITDWKIEEIHEQKTIFYKGKNYIPRDQELWHDIVKIFHDHETVGHLGELETYNSVKVHYWWPGMQMFINNYVQGCGHCQHFKINCSPAKPAYQPIAGAKNTCPFVNCSRDLITDLPPVNSYDSILVVVDQGLSKGVVLFPCAKTITWEGIAELLQDNLFKKFRLPDRIISDRDPQFAARAFQELLKLLNITLSLSTTYHPQMDGATEQVNQEIEAYLSIYSTAHLEDWLKSLSTLEFIHNNRRHADQTHTPFEFILGDNPIAVPLTFTHTKYLIIEKKMKRLLHEREEALAAHKLARTRMANWKQLKYTPFEKGQKVWLNTWNFKTGDHKKIAQNKKDHLKLKKH